jgi:predicted nicotinamide N-methyase
VSDTEYQHLLAQAQRDYSVITESLTLGSLALQIVRVQDPDALLEDETLLQPHDQLPYHPYWAAAWDASFGVASDLARRDLSGMQILDLGCGLGITGAVAAARGGHVWMVDHAPPALLFARLNSWPWRERVHTQRVDWRSDTLRQQFDLIVGSEILYDRDDLPHLNRFWREHLADEGSLLLGDASRALTDELLLWLAERDWRVTKAELSTAQSERTIRLFRLSPQQR